ncbi:protein YCF54, chloroplastic [Typha latifolia]|uniref:protein YCF54, chloroplastic n=1 Tax=Typha latifolia TaxID=4733 RepID=UPI003C2FDFD9
MLAPATLSLRPCAGLVSCQAERSFSRGTPSLLLPPSSVHSRTSTRGAQLRFVSSPPLRAFAVESNQLGSSQPAEKAEKPSRYYFVVANAKFMLDEEEHFKEQLDERLRLFGERKREQDFWLVIEPKFLDKFPNITKRLKRPAVALVSTDGTWMTFMKLRLDRVLADNFEADTLDDALASNPVDLHFEKPENWVAPYPKYESGWWEPFLPPGSSKNNA